MQSAGLGGQIPERNEKQVAVTREARELRPALPPVFLATVTEGEK